MPNDNHDNPCNDSSSDPSADYVSSSGNADYKYLMLKVPDYEGSRDGSESKVSYLRMGANPRPSDQITEEGGELVDKAKKAILETGATWFEDDFRDRTGDGDAAGQAKRQAVSAKLVEKCGWRDHSDGNRISTTGGDKIEVIRGNYKLMVLGRQDDKDDAAITDISGGLIQTGDIAPGAISSIKWVKDGETWRVQEETEKGDVKTVFHGKSEEYFYGSLKKSVVGAANSNDAVGFESNPGSTATKAKPYVLDETYASKVKSYTAIGTALDGSDFTSDHEPGDNDSLEIINCQGKLESRVIAGSIREQRGQVLKGVPMTSDVFGTSDEHWYGNFFGEGRKTRGADGPRHAVL